MKAGFLIRKYRDEDYEVVRELYATGFGEHLNTVCLQALKQIWVQLTLGFFLVAVTVLAGSFSIAVLGSLFILVVGREVVKYLFNQGIQLGLREDLSDIDASYMQEGRISCFWVAERQGDVVGTVAILPCVSQGGVWELKRISVRRDFRRMGIAKALCRTALRFVTTHGVQKVVLYTSMLQTDAHQLYHSIGFHRIEEFLWPSLPAKLIKFMVFKYGWCMTSSKAD